MSRIRHIVNDVDGAIEFYTEQLHFGLVQQFGLAMAMVSWVPRGTWSSDSAYELNFQKLLFAGSGT